MQIMASNALPQIRAIVNSYFQPLLDLISYLASESGRGRIEVFRRDNSKIVRIAAKVVTRAVCLNQGAYLEYTYLASEKHRKLKELLQDNDPNLLEVQRLSADLVDFMNRKFYEVVQENFALLLAYFNERSNSPPRICIKGNFRVGKSDQVVTVFRNAHVAYASSVEIGRNSGFSYIQNTGKHFIENDIPSAAAEDRYFNPRLDNDLVKQLSSAGELLPSTWMKCWKDATEAPEAYQSTLIIPMTLWNNQISEEFRSAVKIDNVGRTIFGYLCFDHTERGFFDEENDTNVGYVVADLISMYIFSRTVFIEVSRTYDKATSLMSKNGIEGAVERLDTKLIEAMAAKVSNIDFNSVIRKSANNKLFQLDEQLLHFTGSAPEAVEKNPRKPTT